MAYDTFLLNQINVGFSGVFVQWMCLVSEFKVLHLSAHPSWMIQLCSLETAKCVTNARLGQLLSASLRLKCPYMKQLVSQGE